MLEDKLSRKIYLSKLNYYMTGNSLYLNNLTDSNKQYFDKELIQLREDEIFVDCGSYNGDTLEIFYELTKGKYKKYIALEADEKTCQELIQKIKENHYLNVNVLDYACWHEKTELKFKAMQTDSSCIAEEEIIIRTSNYIDEVNAVVKADSLDHLLDNTPVTFIKMDIEGAEENALKGTEKLIRKYKPILAICIYHKIEDYYRLPLLIKKYNENYHLFIRHYKEGLANETVCYAIPKERLIKK